MQKTEMYQEVIDDLYDELSDIEDGEEPENARQSAQRGIRIGELNKCIRILESMRERLWADR